MRIFGFTEYGGPQVAGFLDVPAPQAEGDGVLIDVEATTVNPGDIKVRSGQRQKSFPVRFPMAMGREAAGTIRALGPNAPAGLDVGQRVFGSAAPGIGTFAEQTVLTGASATPVPEELSAGRAASIPVAFGTAHDALNQLRLRPGQPLLVLGAGGGVGSSALSLAKAAGLTVWGVGSAGKHDVITRMGAQHVESGTGWADRVRQLGTPAAILDLVGGEVLRQGAQLLADEAPGSFAGDAAGEAAGQRVRIVSAADPALAKELGGSGIVRHRTREVFARIAQLLAASAAPTWVSARYRFADAAQAVADVEDGHAAGKIIIRI